MNRDWKIAECFKVNYYPDIDAKFPRFENSWNGERTSFRVTGFYRIYERPEPKNHKESISSKIISRILDDRHNLKTEMDKMIHRFSVVLEQCLFEESEFIYGQSLFYPMVPIEWCEYIGDVKWNSDKIEQERQRYVDGIERERTHNDVHRYRTTHPRYDDAVTQLVQGGLEGGKRIEDDEYHYYNEWCQKYANKKYFELMIERESDEEEE